jgi:DNA invertase Pin-like site-specific DNA recombinase
MPEVGPEHTETSQQNQTENIAWFYGRYSDSELQNKDSIDQQLLASRNDAAKQGQIIPQERVFADEGIRGSVGDRPDLKRLQDLIRSGVKCTDLYIFDKSRLARDREIAARLHNFFDYHKVRVHYVANGMVSGSHGFNLQHAIYSAFDQQFSCTLGENVKRGHRHRFETGYRSVRVVDPVSPKGGRQSGTLGSRLVINEDEAEVVRRIFQLFADGGSMMGIAKALNRDRIPSPQNSRARKQGSQWCSSAIQDILHNEKYKGVYVWNATYQSEHPKSGLLMKVKKAEHEVIRLERPEIRIVLDTLWDAAAARLAGMQDKQVRRVQGGYNRATNRPYLYSGFLYCGECRQKLIVNGLQGKARYKCKTARLHRGCNNRMSIPERVVAEQLTRILSTQLLMPEIFDELITDVIAEVDAAVQRERGEARRAELPELEKHLQACNSALTNLMNSLSSRRRLLFLNACESVTANGFFCWRRSALLATGSELQSHANCSRTSSRRIFPSYEMCLRATSLWRGSSCRDTSSSCTSSLTPMLVTIAFLSSEDLICSAVPMPQIRAC